VQYSFYTCDANGSNPANHTTATADGIELAIATMIVKDAPAYAVVVEGFDPVRVARHPNGGWYIPGEHLESGNFADHHLVSVLLEAVDIVDDYIDGAAGL